MTRRVVTIVGARPQFIKAAVVSRAIAAEPQLEEILIHTGQHYDANMSDVFFDELQIPPPWRHLGVASGSHGAMTGRMLVKIEKALLEIKPDAVVVYGDTNSTLAGALAAAKLHIPIIHSEAGLRSFNRRMPEEVNRVLTDHVSTLLLCPTHVAVKNLSREGISNGVKHIGDIMFDATLFAIEQRATRSKIIQTLGIEGRSFALCTLHRAENTDDPARLATLVDFLRSEAGKRLIVFPLHPRTRKALAAVGRELQGMIVTDPMGYFDLHGLLAGADLVMTDSGGLQKEAYFHRTPCVTLRDETEWVETVDSGWNRLWNVPEWRSPRVEIPDYGSGAAGRLTVEAILDLLR
ncbi:MAG: UDP-N-acetylglucosamine 2-epimerase (non-hydrolyzing) [Xanthobacteraceae bacterium]